jgi:hypothetical protein
MPEPVSNQAMLRVRLAQVERSLAYAERQVARQREIIAELDRRRQFAGSLLAKFESQFASRIADRDRLRAQLGQNKSLGSMSLTEALASLVHHDDAPAIGGMADDLNVRPL